MCAYSSYSRHEDLVLEVFWQALYHQLNTIAVEKAVVFIFTITVKHWRANTAWRQSLYKGHKSGNLNKNLQLKMLNGTNFWRGVKISNPSSTVNVKGWAFRIRIALQYITVLCQRSWLWCLQTVWQTALLCQRAHMHTKTGNTTYTSS